MQKLILSLSWDGLLILVRMCLDLAANTEIKDEASGVPPANESSFRKARDSQRATSSVKGRLKKEICSSA